MRRVVLGTLALLGLLLVIGIALPVVVGLRARADRLRCQDNFRRIEYAGLHAGLPGNPVPGEGNDYFPPGTIVRPDLEPDQRLSWYVSIVPALESVVSEGHAAAAKKMAQPSALAQMASGIDLKRPWDDPANEGPGRTRIATLLCPAGVPSWPLGWPALTQYIGMGGIGLDTPTLPLEKAGKRAGVFRYDGPLPLALIRDGLSQTIAYSESNVELGPWIRGGPSTVRGLDPASIPYLGVGRPFAGLHMAGGNFGFADGSVRFLAEAIDPAVFRALLTIAGQESEEFDSPGP